MAITYNKQVVKKDRSIQSRGPRDHQRRSGLGAVDSNIIDELKNQVLELQNQLNKNVGNVSGEEIDAKIIEAVQEETEFLKKKHILEIDALKEKVKNLQDVIKEKDALIEQLKTSNSSISEDKLAELLSNVSGGAVVNSSDNRPKMETKFIDPVEDKKDVESHIDIKEEKSSSGESISNKVNKLKSLLGKS
jgi:hypothetical protein